jgi:hypothetical protein
MLEQAHHFSIVFICSHHYFFYHIIHQQNNRSLIYLFSINLLHTMLNAIPDKRSTSELPVGFLTPNHTVGGVHDDEVEEQVIQGVDEAISLGERRKSSVYSGHSESSSSVEVPPRNHIVDMGKKEFLLFEKNLF